jgi:hypothetical protein
VEVILAATAFLEKKTDPEEITVASIKVKDNKDFKLRIVYFVYLNLKTKV